MRLDKVVYQEFQAHVSIHARVERATAERKAIFDTVLVSIHARVERATNIDPDQQLCGVVSIHARVERATLVLL